MIKTKLVEAHQFATNEFEKDINKAIRELAVDKYKIIDVKIAQMPGPDHQPGVAMIIYDNNRSVYDEIQILKRKREMALALTDLYNSKAKD